MKHREYRRFLQGMKLRKRSRARRYIVLPALVTLAAACGGGGDSATPPVPPAPPDPQPGTLALGDSAYSIDEADSTLDIEVTRASGADGLVSVRLSTRPDSADENDYVPVDTTISFADQDSVAKTVSIQLNDDQLVEAAETFHVLLTDATGGAVLGADDAVVTITDNDHEPQPAGSAMLNDTGVDLCLDTSSRSFVSCANGGALSSQDGAGGRDVDVPGDSDGRLGFVLAKLDSAGVPLADQTVDYATTAWSCVLDEITGLTWEVKSADEPDVALDSGTATFTWWDPNTQSRGASYRAGTCALGDCTSGDYVQAQNELALCGYSDWRLPTPGELLSLIDYGADSSPLIDLRFFPNSHTAYWADGGKTSLQRPFVSFGDGFVTQIGPQSDLGVRLVRGGL